MPEDKWHIPFIYPTKKSAGITGTGTAFFWQQANDIFDDNDSGMVRLGKEHTDQHAVFVIDESTGEWEFPYLTDGDGLSMSGPTGHHSGGETHGCQGFTYMCDGDFSVNPPTFRFRKETYHVQYNTDPITGEDWTSPFATGPVANHWKGAKWIRYNKKDGISAGKDSVICEYWWNDDPTTDIKNWKMLKRTEDKGAGISNWGVAATCDGDAYQVGTWSNVQFRFKSSSSDFSLHPLIPEGEDDPNVHSIGGEDMSFADSAARGYGKRADMPRDIEMTCLFKWDAGGRGKCHFKNISLREIDPTLSFDDDQNEPDPGQEPTETTEIKGFFKLLRDINTYRTSSCAGAGGGGGAGGSTKFYDNLTLSPTSNKGITTAFSGTVSIGEYAVNSSSPMVGKILKQFDVPLKKVGTPPASPTVQAIIRDSAGTLVYASPTTIDPTTLTTSYVTQSFDFSANTHSFVSGDRILVAISTSSSTDYVQVGFNTGTIANSAAFYFTTSFVPDSANDLNCAMWQ